MWCSNLASLFPRSHLLSNVQEMEAFKTSRHIEQQQYVSRSSVILVAHLPRRMTNLALICNTCRNCKVYKCTAMACWNTEKVRLEANCLAHSVSPLVLYSVADIYNILKFASVLFHSTSTYYYLSSRQEGVLLLWQQGKTGLSGNEAIRSISWQTKSPFLPKNTGWLWETFTRITLHLIKQSAVIHIVE